MRSRPMPWTHLALRPRRPWRAAAMLCLMALAVLAGGDATAAEPPSKLPAEPPSKLPAEPSPELQVVKAERVQLAKARHIHWDGQEIETTVLVELTVRTPLPVPVTSRSPLLRVGERLVGYVEYLEPDLLRFTEHQPAKLTEGGAVSLQIGYEAGQPLYASGFVYKAGTLEVVKR